ncbi:MAG: histidine kinase [Actinomycetota bacterium]|nr:histidine kinase [Actinomycetota bacterium]
MGKSSVRSALRTEWEALGGVGRAALLGLLASVIVAWFLGVGIPAAVEADLIASHLESLSLAVDDLTADGVIAVDGGMGDEEALREFWQRSMVGGSVVGINLWGAGAATTFSSDPSLATAFSENRLDLALSGEAQGGHAGGDGGSYAADSSMGHLWEFYIPVRNAGGEVTAVVQILEVTATLHDGLASIRRWLWLGIAVGLSALLVFNALVVAANTRELAHRRDQAEGLLADLAHAQEEERVRIMGALHDDVGQPLYRVLYGVEGCRAQLEGNTAVRDELASIAALIRSIDGTLRSELHMLHQGEIDQLDLRTLLVRLADEVRRESHVEVTLDIAENHLPNGSRAALFRAVREAVTNARRHGAAHRIDIALAVRQGRVVLDVEDDGIGFDGELGLGLTTARTRLEAAGGGLRVTRRTRGGTLFRAWVPVGSGET